MKLEVWQRHFETLWQDRIAKEEAEGERQDGSHDLSHIHRVWSNCRQIMTGEDMDVDQEIVLAAVFFHDWVNLPKNAKNRETASAQSAEAAVKILTDVGFPIQKLPGVTHAITAHSFSANIEPTTIEAKVLQDADRLDSLGAIGIARIFYISGQLGGSLYEPSDPGVRHRDLNDRRFAFDHFYAKILTLAGQMKTQTGRAIADKRNDVIKRYMADFLDEVSDVDF